ncbi:hypothetical protein KP79_PYT14441 [Mizuhopecten yessoensis]|uniref:IgGFc-binding protein N-terminal domain-containing protein n=1 Tax=Mizuhopecten yessoensis TaxID=6573 RepID=A0A210QHB6_MIZYE|nr:hypothetical protein KP79_PYT14441 [Mizuhopecten yessoensis]
MLPPLHALSQTYFVIPKPSYKVPELVRVVSIVSNTEVRINDGTSMQVVLLESAGSFHEFSLTSESGVIITGDDKIQVAQISLSDSIGGGYGDPCMSLAISPEDFLTEYVFFVPDTELFALVQSNLVVIYKKDAKVKLDDVYLPNNTAVIDIADSDFIFAEIEGISPGTHTLTGGDSGTRLAGILYGYGIRNQYQMPIGRNLGKLSAQIGVSKSLLSDKFRGTEMSSRFTDYLPFEAPFLNIATVSKIECALLCSESSTCYILAIKLAEGSVWVECLLYTIAAASSQLHSAPGYTLYRRLK